MCSFMRYSHFYWEMDYNKQQDNFFEKKKCTVHGALPEEEYVELTKNITGEKF